jgi:hypothetical protein
LFLPATLAHHLFHKDLVDHGLPAVLVSLMMMYLLLLTLLPLRIDTYFI